MKNIKNFKITIYVLIDPISLKVRYIGRTRSSLKTRLCQHISKTKSHVKKRIKLTHKENWINKILKYNLKPIIRKLCVLECTWKESHTFEQKLIHKHAESHNLVNSDDRGEGGINRIVSDETRAMISNTLKRGIQSGDIVVKTTKPVYVYDITGSFVKKYESNISAASDLNVTMSHIAKQKCGHTKRPTNGYYFRHQYESSITPYVYKPPRSLKITMVSKTDNEKLNFNTIKDFAKHINKNSYCSLAHMTTRSWFKDLLIEYDIYKDGKLIKLAVL